LPQIAWRAGLDLEPLSASQPSHRAWLEALVWPEQTGRLERLRQALTVAQEARPRVVAGDLRTDLAAQTRQAPAGVTRVIFHTAVLAYVAAPHDRAAFAAEARRLADYWIANEVPSALPGLDASFVERAQGRFLMCLNGRPMAWTDPHGAALEWIGPAA
jgi:hypothetical protein